MQPISQKTLSMKKGLLYAILASVLWAIVNPFIKQGLSYDFTPMNFAGIRFTMFGLLCLVMSALFRQATEMKAENDLTI